MSNLCCLLPGCHAVNGHEKDLLGLDHPEEDLNVVKYVLEYLFFRDPANFSEHFDSDEINQGLRVFGGRPVHFKMI